MFVVVCECFLIVGYSKRTSVHSPNKHTGHCAIDEKFSNKNVKLPRYFAAKQRFIELIII